MTILLIPAPEHRDALLREGSCGSRVPTAYQRWFENYGHPEGGSWDPDWTFCTEDDYVREEGHTALVLAYEGQPVAEGCDRAARVRGLTIENDWTMRDVQAVADACVAFGLGTLALVPPPSQESR